MVILTVKIIVNIKYYSMNALSLYMATLYQIHNCKMNSIIPIFLGKKKKSKNNMRAV